eukprot:PITA_25071
MPHTLQEAIQRAIIVEEEIMNSGPSKSTRPTGSRVPSGNSLECRNLQRGLVLNHQKCSAGNQRTPYRHPSQHPHRVPQESRQPQQHRPMRQHQVTPPQHQSQQSGFFQQSSRSTPGSIGSRRKAPKRGCWTCGGPHYEMDCPQKTGNTNSIKNSTTVGDLGKAHHIHATVNNRQVEHQFVVLETSGNIDGMSFVILIDRGAIDSFISLNALSRNKHKGIAQYEFRNVEMTCVIGMDWLERHEVLLDYKDKILHFTDDDGQRKSLRGKNLWVSLRFISSMQLVKYRRKGCQMFSVVALNDKGDSENLDKHPFLVEFKDVFPEELPGLAPKREIDFTINLKPGTEPIAKAPYYMSVLELKELQIQLRELLDLGFI